MDKKDIKIIVTNPMFISNNRTATVLFPDDKPIVLQGACPATIIYLANQYNVEKIYIKGNKLYNKKLVKEIQEEELRTYRDKILKFEFI